MIARSPKSLALSLAALLIAIALIVIGARRTQKVYDATDEFGMQVFTRVPEKQLIIDATFAGTKRDGDKLVSTYDRTAPPPGRRACPT